MIIVIHSNDDDDDDDDDSHEARGPIRRLCSLHGYAAR